MKGCGLSVPYAAVSAERLILGGTVAAEKVAADIIEIVSPNAEVEGVLDMSEPGEIVLASAFGSSFDTGETVKLVSTSAVIGDESEWTVSGPLTERWRFVLSVGDDGLYADVYGRGLTIILK